MIYLFVSHVLRIVIIYLDWNQRSFSNKIRAAYPRADQFGAYKMTDGLGWGGVTGALF